MNVLIDTNILISAALFPGSKPDAAYEKATSFPFDAMISEQTIDEMNRIFARKFPEKIYALNNFLSTALLVLKIIPVPDKEEILEGYIRDTKDRPILRCAITANADILLTGDRDFLESGITKPRIMTASEFLML